VINGTRWAWKGTKAFARASARNNMLTAGFTKGGGAMRGGSGGDDIIAELRSEAAYSLGYAMGRRKRRKMEKAAEAMQAEVAQWAEAGELAYAAMAVLRFQITWDVIVDKTAWPELEAMCEELAAAVLARRKARRG
jgi:hypothetical protein